MPANDALELAREIVKEQHEFHGGMQDCAACVDIVARALTAFAADHLAVIEAKDAALQEQIRWNDHFGSGSWPERLRERVRAALALTPATLRAQAAAREKVIEAVNRFANVRADAYAVQFDGPSVDAQSEALEHLLRAHQQLAALTAAQRPEAGPERAE